MIRKHMLEATVRRLRRRGFHVLTELLHAPVPRASMSMGLKALKELGIVPATVLDVGASDEGFKKTSGEITAWLNSDDKCHHQAFYKVAYIFTTYPHMEWITGRHTKWKTNGELTWIYPESLARFSREKFLKKVYNDPSIQQESTFWRRSLWQKAGGMIRSDLDYAGDLELWIRFFRHAQLHSVETLFGGYREHGNQKAILYLDRYTREAEKVLDAESRHSDEETIRISCLRENRSLYTLRQSGPISTRSMHRQDMPSTKSR